MLRIAESTGVIIALSIRGLSLAFGMTFLLVGICGFISGCVDGYDTLRFAGPSSHALLFGLFRVSVLHNIVHLAFGVAGLACCSRAVKASRYLLVGGLIYLVLWSYGMIVMTVAPDSYANLLPMNTADNWLHFVLAVTMSILGLLTGFPARLATRAVPDER